MFNVFSNNNYSFFGNFTNVFSNSNYTVFESCSRSFSEYQTSLTIAAAASYMLYQVGKMIVNLPSVNERIEWAKQSYANGFRVTPGLEPHLDRGILMQAAKIAEDEVEAFESQLELKRKDASELADALKQSTISREIFQRAKEIIKRKGTSPASLAHGSRLDRDNLVAQYKAISPLKRKKEQISQDLSARVSRGEITSEDKEYVLSQLGYR